ncbi:AAA family ATPase [Oribacterium sp. P6A1]|uniref:AAA family ATPase n=1 Tax=Oribacterium sp. P6A1 TaxID=1410612 RepID=UPI00055FAAD9|nr:hypothetical protein [Oribacterium sp. P6A1]
MGKNVMEMEKMGMFDNYDESYLEDMYFKCENICGPRGTGKTSFLKALMKYFGDIGEERLDSEPIEREHLSNYGKHPIIFLDFSDCSSNTPEKMMKYIRKKMSELYISLWKECRDELWGYSSYSEYLDIIEGTCNDKLLSRSLVKIVHLSRMRRTLGGCHERPMIFIDEISKPLLYASEYGFYNDLQKFYDDFLEIDHYELTGGIYTTSFAPLNTDVKYKLKYISDRPVNDVEPLAIYCLSHSMAMNMDCQRRIHGWDYRYFDKEITLSECFHVYKKEYKDKCARETGEEIALSPEMKALVCEKRKWIKEEEKKAIEQKCLEEKRKAEEYAANLPDGSNIPSKYAGIRNLDITVCDKKKYERLNCIIQTLAREHGNRIKLHDVYDYMQGLKRNEKITGIDSLVIRLKEIASSNTSLHRCEVKANDSHWVRFDVRRLEKEPGYGDLGLVKVYLSVCDESRITEVFEDVVNFLIDHGQHLFHSKISCYRRNDHICIWVAREDFFTLEQHLGKYDSILFTPLPFVAYRNKLGISREFWSWESHNGVQATLICTYLRSKSDTAKIDVLEMYSKYVSAWNGDLAAEDVFTKEFKGGNAQEFLVLLETLDVLMGNDVIDDGHLLLNADAKLWHDLGKSKNWYEVGMNRKA